MLDEKKYLASVKRFLSAAVSKHQKEEQKKRAAMKRANTRYSETFLLSRVSKDGKHISNISWIV